MMAISAILDPSWLAKPIGKGQVGPMEKYGKDGRNALETNYLQKRSVLHKRSWRKIWGKLARQCCIHQQRGVLPPSGEQCRRRSLSAPTGSIPLSESRFAQSLAG